MTISCFLLLTSIRVEPILCAYPNYTAPLLQFLPKKNEGKLTKDKTDLSSHDNHWKILDPVVT